MHCFKLHRSYSVSFNLLNVEEFSGVESERTVSKFSETYMKFLCCIYLLHKLGAWNKEVSCHSCARNVQTSMMHVQSCCFANLHVNLLLLLPSSLPSPSLLLKLPIVVVRYHGNMMSHFSFVLSYLTVDKYLW